MSFGGKGVWPSNVRLNGLTIFSFELANTISLANGDVVNLFNSTNGMLSGNGTLTISGDSWDRMTPFESEYLRPDAYLHTDSPYQDIETNVFVRIPTVISGAVARGLIAELRRRTPASPTTPVAIPDREIEIITNQAVTTATVQRLPTRSNGITDNYYVYGYSIYIINDSDTTIDIPASGRIRVEILSRYRKPVLFNTLQSPNL